MDQSHISQVLHVVAGRLRLFVIGDVTAVVFICTYIYVCKVTADAQAKHICLKKKKKKNPHENFVNKPTIKVTPY